MAHTLDDLYLKYINRVGKTLENDRYFQYLFEMARAGASTIQQKNEILHKVVDEKWLDITEETIDSIYKIIDKPRRFVTTEEEVVPVALAKKITADSVRHLSMNTQFIASDEDGDVQPTRILNVSTTESFDLYENRFIYHLIQRLVSFIDKRTDVIFWSTGDETRNTLSFATTVDDAYEVIDYKLEMTVKNRQSFAENDSDNMQVFMRIDRIRRLVMGLKNSSFCSIMAGCAKVRSPIQRTNLMMKDPDYRACYRLWQFLENYDDVGYTIDVQDRALEFDEEYLFQLYTNLITNYIVFKSILDIDRRELDEIAPKRRKIIKPKFIKQIKEEFVEDYDIPDVEIRKVLIEQVTQAQLDAEAQLATESARRKELEEELERSDEQLQSAFAQLNAAMRQSMEAETRAEEAVAAQEAAEQALQEATEARELAEADAATFKQARDAAEEARAIQEEAARAAEAARAEAERTMHKAVQSREAAEANAAATMEQYAAFLAERDRLEEATRVSEEARAAAEAAKEEADAARALAEADAAESKQARDAAEEARTAAEETSRIAEEARAALSTELAQEKKLRGAAELQIDEINARIEHAQNALKEAYLAKQQAETACEQAETARARAEKKLDTAQRTAQAEAKAREETMARLEQIKQAVRERVERVEKDAAARIEKSEQAARESENKREAAYKARRQAERQRVMAEQTRDAALSDIAELTAARDSAQAAAAEALERARAAEAELAQLQTRLDESILSRLFLSRGRGQRPSDSSGSGGANE